MSIRKTLRRVDVLPQLERGCLNYREAGNWALHDDAEPRGAKSLLLHRRVHLHILGRSRTASDPSWTWGEWPQWPRFEDRFAWAAKHERLTPEECARIVERTAEVLATSYAIFDNIP